MTHNQEIRRELQHQVQRKQYLEGLTAELEGQLQQLREKIEDDPASPKFIVTKRGMGYLFGG